METQISFQEDERFSPKLIQTPQFVNFNEPLPCPLKGKLIQGSLDPTTVV
jgi:hypothetical protein